MDVAAVSSTGATCPHDVHSSNYLARQFSEKPMSGPYTSMRVPAYAGRIDETHLVTVIIIFLTSFHWNTRPTRWPHAPHAQQLQARRRGGLRGDAAAMVQDGEAFDAMASPCFLVFSFLSFFRLLLILLLTFIFFLPSSKSPGLLFFLLEDSLHDSPAYQQNVRWW
ncbi:hypothetical protein CP532_5005 [Ophiocordyceps camponoti-leonardi (nom. inval.)]|nr:hypothetical protein CP532_5005 [Ophiocordyceps camponoti-leonardi (nom. inval.)]